VNYLYYFLVFLAQEIILFVKKVKSFIQCLIETVDLGLGKAKYSDKPILSKYKTNY
jgi:hypothetical protein